MAKRTQTTEEKALKLVRVLLEKAISNSDGSFGVTTLTNFERRTIREFKTKRESDNTFSELEELVFDLLNGCFDISDYNQSAEPVVSTLEGAKQMLFNFNESKDMFYSYNVSYQKRYFNLIAYLRDKILYCKNFNNLQKHIQETCAI